MEQRVGQDEKMVVALIDKNPKTQFAIGHNYPVFTNLQSLKQDIADYAPDWVFIFIKYGMDQIREAIKNTKAAYIFADYRNPLPEFALQLSHMSDITVTSWKQPSLWKTLKNPHVIRRATDPNKFKPLPEIKPIYDVVFAGNNVGGKPRMKVLEFLYKNFNLYIVGAGWPKKFNQLGRKTGSYVSLNKHLNEGKVTVDIFNRTDMVKEGVSYYTSNRPYQNMAVGRPHLQPYVPGVQEFFEKGYLDYKDLDQLKTQIEILLSTSQEKRDEIGRVQRNEIVTRHTYAHAWAYMENIIEKNLFKSK